MTMDKTIIYAPVVAGETSVKRDGGDVHEIAWEMVLMLQLQLRG